MLCRARAGDRGLGADPALSTSHHPCQPLAKSPLLRNSGASDPNQPMPLTHAHPLHVEQAVFAARSLPASWQTPTHPWTEELTEGFIQQFYPSSNTSWPQKPAEIPACYEERLSETNPHLLPWLHLRLLAGCGRSRAQGSSSSL